MIPVKINVDTGVIMQKISFLLLGTSLSLIPQTLSAAECAVTDCSLLGYTDSACPGSGLKCPFGEGWYCGGGAAEDCIKLGYDKSCTGAGERGSGETCNGKYKTCTCDSSYKYTCSGTGYSGGSGTACGGKYTACTCKSPYTWSSGACKCPSTYQYTCSGTGYSGGSGTACGGKYTSCTCASGYEWNGSSCQQQLNGAQGDLYYCNGTVVGVRATGMNFYIAMQDLSMMMNWTSANSSCQSYAFCGNVKGALPTLDQLKTLYNNKSRVNTLLLINGGTQLTNNYYWSSTYYGSYGYSIVDMSSGDYSWDGLVNYGYVLPVLASW